MSKNNGHKTSKTNGHETIDLEEKVPTGKELLKMYPPPKKLTPELKALKESTRKAMEALDREIEKYGYPPDFRH